MRYGVASLSLGLAIGAVACANGTALESTDASHEGQSSAVVFVERQASDGALVTAHVGARFVRFTGLPAEALPDLIGTPRIPGVATGCAERLEPSLDGTPGQAEAQLLDVGAIDVRAGNHTLRLDPRRFPDLWNVVSGVVYAADDDLPADVWHFSAPGNVQTRMPGFEVDAHAPDELTGVSVADQAFGPGGSVTFPRHPFSVRWTAGDSTDTVVLAVEPASSSEHTAAVVCSVRDDGELDIDATWAEHIADLAHAGSTVTLRRVRTRAITSLAMDTAAVVFDFSIRGHSE